ncbi:MAG TPA: PP2C family protein-serine/threonine phosphatase [Thermoanaerobaculia bacterium]|nr:PP2C family protein-serine/threonine phosphatase [Thermoanaerobaculia bacterium]
MDIGLANDALQPSLHNEEIANGISLRERVSPRYVVKATSRPATAYTADFFFASDISGVLWFAVGDFAGHGLRAAIFMAFIQEELERLIRSCSSSDPAEIVASLDSALRDVIPFNRFATLVVGRAFPDGSMGIVNAGHCYPFVIHGDGSLNLICSRGPVVGLAPSPAWHQQSLRLSAGDRLIVYTDGIVEAESEEGLDFGTERLYSLIRTLPHEEVLDGVMDAVRQFVDGPQVDDMTLFVLRAE